MPNLNGEYAEKACVFFIGCVRDSIKLNLFEYFRVASNFAVWKEQSVGETYICK